MICFQDARLLHRYLQNNVILVTQVTDEEALPLIYDLLKQEGFCMGGSTAINIGGMQFKSGCVDLISRIVVHISINISNLRLK